ncbi:MAG: hypothetical protein KBC32_10415 [Candidatus Didemnitutus sp.]|nr:hypothetical protein [Candidatus Didemnitutus sp.]
MKPPASRRAPLMIQRWKHLLAHWSGRWNDLYDGQRRALRLVALTAATAVAASLAYIATRPAIADWRHRHALDQADGFERQEDYRNALLALHRATQIKPSDIETWRRAASLLDALGHSDALVARENLVALDPADANARVALVAAALRLDAPDVARRALRELERAPAQREQFLRLQAELARDAADLSQYETHLAALHALLPHDAEVRYNLALLKLRATEPAQQALGREEMRDLLGEPSVRVRAALDLLREAADRRDSALAGATVHLVVERLAPVAARGRASVDPWPALRSGLQLAAARDGADAARVARWFASVRLADEALAWLDSLPASIARTAAVRDATAELCARTSRLDRLQDLLEAGAWDTLLRRPVSLALEARRQHERQQRARSVALWQDAVVAASNSPVTLRALARLASLWQNPEATEAALRAALRVRPKSIWAYRELRTLYFNRADTPRLLQVCEAWANAHPASPVALSAWIRTAAAVGQITQPMDSRTANLLAEPESGFHAVLARAVVLAHTRQTEAALRLLEPLPPAQRSNPEVLFLLTWIHRERRDLAAAARLAVQIPAHSLLKEEQEMLKALPIRAE